MELKLCIFLLLCLKSLVSASGDPCEAKDTCSKCITHSKCIWCAKADFGKKCITDNSDIRSKCEGHLQVKESIVEVKENETFISTSEKVVQLTPQRINIDLRVGQPTNFNFIYKQAENYPVDLYFLLDASYSMRTVRDALITQSQKIYEVMHKFTDNIRLGIGSFVDKNTFPYVEDPGKKEVYSFRHLLDFTDNVLVFNRALSGITFVRNFDKPEGGLDALAQVLACQNIIRWNRHSRKFVLFITDDQFHVAGDGLLAGIHRPYDGNCYTTKDGIYTKELEMDYPSVSMIYKLAKNIEANLIFIVKHETSTIYYDLNDYLGGILKTYKEGTGDTGTDNFDDKLREAYEDKTKFIKLKPTIPGKISQDNLKIDFTPDCSETNFEFLGEVEKNICEIQESKEINITGTITLDSYNEASKKFTVDIVVNGINEKLQIDVNVITNCDCENGGVKNAPECNENGTLECGLCKCNENWYGSKCKCNNPDDDTDLSSCILNNGKVCSGNGKCECGACKCDSYGGEQTYSGIYCQCNANSCPIGSNGKQCSEHGTCDCGKCICNKIWEGHTCETSTLKTNCMKDNKECTGLGTCVNNTCKCDKPPEWDARQSYDKFCSIISETNQNQCKLLENHARCAYDKKDSCPNEDSVNVTLTKHLTESEKKSMSICDDVRVGTGCYIEFGYKYNDGRTVQLLVEEKANCQESYYRFGGIILATLIIVGICTLAGWKLLTTMRDRKEYEQFLLSSNRRSSIRKNVLYTSPKTTIENPTYENKCE